MPPPLSSLSQATRHISTPCLRTLSRPQAHLRVPSHPARPQPQPQSQSQCQRRPFTSTPHHHRSIEEAKSNTRTGVRILLRATIFVATGAAMVGYFQYEKARMERKRIVEMSKGYGKPKVGGPFKLVDLEGGEFSEEDLKGKYTLIYFGFTHCPDICPDELDKMSLAIDIIHARSPHTLRSIFISVDPARDTPPILSSYLSEFHPSIQGLTGTWEQVKNVCKQYRVYFSTPKDVEQKPGQLAEDYLVDHSIYFYVMDPEGDFVECIGRQDTPESAAGIVLEHVRDWKREGKPIDMTPLPYLSKKVVTPIAEPA